MSVIDPDAYYLLIMRMRDQISKLYPGIREKILSVDRKNISEPQFPVANYIITTLTTTYFPPVFV